MTERVDRRRRLLVSGVVVAGGIGIVATSIPFIASMRPSARAQAAGTPVEVHMGALEPAQQIAVQWRGQPVWVLRRTEQMLENLVSPGLRARLRDPDSLVRSQQPDYARNTYRSIRPEYLVVIGICTHLGCSPNYRPDIAPEDLGPNWLGGYFCPCHGSRFDLAGRVYKHVPAPTNLVVPPHRYLSATSLLIGDDRA